MKRILGVEITLTYTEDDGQDYQSTVFYNRSNTMTAEELQAKSEQLTDKVLMAEGFIEVSREEITS